jgi:hypothetical protein
MRREFLWEMGGGFAGIALASLLNQDGLGLSVSNGADKVTAND